jgi:hypothetical protein
MKDTKLKLRNLHVSTHTHPSHSQTSRLDEVNRRDVCECDGLVCVLEVIDTPSTLRLTRRSTTLVRVMTRNYFVDYETMKHS